MLFSPIAGYFCTDTPGEKDVRNDTLNSSPGSEQKGYFFQLQNFQEHEEYHIRPELVQDDSLYNDQ